MHLRHLTLVSFLPVAFLVCSCGSVAFMREGQPNERLTAPPAGKALVNFHRPSGYGGGAGYAVFDRQTLIGNCEGGMLFQYTCEPGEHIFLGRKDQVTVVKADLLGGKIYDIVVDITIGWWQANITLEPITKNHERRNKVPEWEADEVLYVFVPDEKAKKFEAKMQEDCAEILRDFIGGEKADRVKILGPDDHR